MKAGQKIRVPGGHIETVRALEGVQVFTDENVSGWYHPTKVIPVYRHVTTDGRAVFCTVPE